MNKKDAEIERLKKVNESLEVALTEASAEAYRLRKNYGTLMRGIKSALGLKNWPQVKGKFPGAALKLLKAKIQELEPWL